MDDGKKMGKGRIYDAERDEVFVGEFLHNKKQGTGTVFRRDGKVLKGDYRQNLMDGNFINLNEIEGQKVKKVFNNAKLKNDNYISVNLSSEARV